MPPTRTSSISTRNFSRAWPQSTSNALRSSSIPSLSAWSSTTTTSSCTSGANLSEADKAELKKLNEEDSRTLSNAFTNKLLAATKEGAYVTTDKAALAGLSEAQIAAAAQAAKSRNVEGFVIPLQNTTQQPDLVSLSDRATRQTIFEHSWNRAERGDANDTRDTIARLAQLRAQKAKLLGFPNFAAWKLEDQMAKTPACRFAVHGCDRAGRDRKGRSRSQGHPGCHRRPEGRLPTPALGLGFLCRAGPQSSLRPRRCAGEALLRAQQRPAERRFLRRQSALRTHFQGAPRHSRLPPGCAGLRGLRRERQAPRPLLLRLLQARQQERRSLDVGIRRPVHVCWGRSRWSTTSPICPSRSKANPH